MEVSLKAQRCIVLFKCLHLRWNKSYGRNTVPWPLTVPCVYSFLSVFGGIPATAALARTALNVQSGATSRMSAVLNACALLLIAKILLPFFSYVPMSTIAALLVLVAVRMIDYKHLSHLWTYERHHFVIAILTAFVCVFVDTMIGLVVGAVVSLLIYAKGIADGHVEIVIFHGMGRQADGKTVINSNGVRIKPKLKALQSNDQDFDERFVAYVNVSALDHMELPSRIVAMFKQFKLSTTPLAQRRTSLSASDDAHHSALADVHPDTNVLVHHPHTSSDVEKANLNPLSGSTPYQAIAHMVDPEVLETSLPIILGRDVSVHGAETSYFRPEENMMYALVYRIAGQLSYINANAHITRAKKIVSRAHGIDVLIISMRTVWTLDLDGVDALDTICSIFDSCHIICYIEGVSRIRGVLGEHEFFQKFVREGRCIESWNDIKPLDFN